MSKFHQVSTIPFQMKQKSASENGKVLSYLGTAVRVGFGNRPIQEDVHRNIFSLLKVKISGVGSCALDRPFQMCKGRVEVHTREGLHSSGDTRSLMPTRFAVPDENVAFSSRASPLISCSRFSIGRSVRV